MSAASRQSPHERRVIGIVLALSILPAPPMSGGSLEDAWLGVWRRLADRTGRPDPLGSQLQNGPPQYLEYPLDLRLSAFDTATEDAWRRDPTGARFFVQSLDEFTLTNRAQMKTRAPLGAGWAVDLRYDQQQDRLTQSHLLALTLRGEDIGNTPLFVEATLYPRWEKTDADVMAAVGVRGRPGEVRLRVLAFDAFNDAAYSLARGRGAQLADNRDQRNAPLGFAVEALSARWHGWRAELYGGIVPGYTTTRTTPDQPIPRGHRRNAWMVGGLAEYAQTRWLAGVSALHVDTQDHWSQRQVATIDAFEREVRLYGQVKLPARLLARGDLVQVARDREQRWILDGRLRWTPGQFGAEVGYMRGSRPRAAVGKLGVAHRLVTRVTFAIDRALWMALGTGWDLDPGEGAYDGSGLTMMLDW